MICLDLQNTSHIRWSPRCWNEIFSQPAIFLVVQTANWGPDLENMVSAAAVRNLNRTISPSFSLTCDTVRCLGRIGSSCAPCADVFLRLRSSIHPTKQCNIRCWWFYLFQGNQCKWFLFHTKKTDAMTFPAHCWVFGRFGRLSPAAIHSDDWRLDSGV